MPLIRSEDAPSFTLDSLTVTGLASPSRHASETCVWRVHLEPLSAGAEHSVDREEIFLALSGAADFVLDDVTTTVVAGDAFVVPAHTPFSLVVGDTAFDAVCVLPVGGRACLTGGEPFVPPWAA
ncbi:MAG: cupin domain-containing protein [Microthrixaceae bacterium]